MSKRTIFKKKEGECEVNEGRTHVDIQEELKKVLNIDRRSDE